MYSKFNNAPCKDCIKREAGCHSKCPDYQEFEKKRNEFYEERLAEYTRVDKTYPAKQLKGVIRKMRGY